MKRIFVIQGGGRPRGHTARLVESFVQGAQDAGHPCEVFSTARHTIHGCPGYSACRC